MRVEKDYPRITGRSNLHLPASASSLAESSSEISRLAALSPCTSYSYSAQLLETTSAHTALCYAHIRN